jgi:sugar phosphate isomerase/epimerase
MEVLATHFGDEKAIDILQGNGFEAIDYPFHSLANDHPFFGENYQEYYARIRKRADERGISFIQSHAPFPSYRLGDDVYNQKIVPLIERSLEVTSILGGTICVIHPIMTHPHKSTPAILDEEFAMSMDFYRSLIPVALQFGVKIGIENMFKSDPENKVLLPAPCSSSADYLRYIDTLDSEWAVACVDLGHAEIVHAGDNAVSLLRALGSRVKTLHIQDTNLKEDLHTVPLMGFQDWDTILNALKEIGYAGEFNLEADSFLERFPKELVVQGSGLMSQVGHYFVNTYFPE